ncbi:MAG: anthranilate synthase component I [Candidatus Alcyoniella australis]|nr:anthranilate synthase component I [Candidatus Alcyoniella australis]
MIKPSLQGFIERAQRGNLIPVYQEILADLETPISAYLALSRGAYGFLLESVEGGTNVGRYSFLGFEPTTIFSSKGEQIEIRRGRDVEQRRGNPLDALRELMSDYRPVVDEGMPPFIGGAVGYLAYDLVRHFERLPDALPDDMGLPDCLLLIPQVLLVFDRSNKTIKVICVAHVNGDPQAAYQRAAAKVGQVVRMLQTHTVKRPLEPLEIETGQQIDSTMRPEQYMAAVERCKEYIRAGDILQVVLSQRFSTEFAGDPFDLYRRLRMVNPSPYMFYLDLDGMQLVGSSPETHVKVVGRKATVRPIAGTRKRGKTAGEDRELAIDLLSDEKEGAEHIMLVDLGRNDLGRICQPGTVEVTQLRKVEHYSHVMHMVSSVEGLLSADQDAFDAIRATFPAGTVSGAPKIRAMEIIDELETTKRGPYSGIVGYFSFDGNLDSCITIRTALVRDGRLHVQAGAGIVADSQPELEHEETRNKARAVFAALGLEWSGR